MKAQLLDRDPARAAQIDLHRWLDEPGLPPDAPRPVSTALEAVDRQIARWKERRDPRAIESSGWATQQWLHFLEGIADGLDARAMAALDERFDLTASHNSEIICVWLRLAIACDYAAAKPRLAEFLTEVGRRKFLKPLYTELAKTPAGLALARQIYATARPRYHAVSSSTVDKLLEQRN